MSNDNKFSIPKFNESQQNIEIKNDVDYMSCVYNSKSPTARTILITNNYSQTNKQSSAANNSSSITIFTHTTDPDVPTKLPLDGINILINNHFNEPQSLISNMPSSVNSSPNGRAKESDISRKPPLIDDENNGNTFAKGDEVLAIQLDDGYSLGTIIKVVGTQCLVNFGENSRDWVHSSKLKRLDKQETILVCILCHNGSDFVDKCYKCDRGYHMKCAGTLSGIWFCKRRHKNLVKVESGLDTAISLSNVSELPYDFDSLTWNSSHKVNGQDTYCYCGKSGSWFKQMIHCARCRQWFHGDCIKSLRFPLYCGDRFYVFVCSICNHGTEYLQRLQMKIEDVIELILFNLTVYQNKRLYDVLRVIVPYARDNWFSLQLSLNMEEMKFDDIRDQIISVLNGQRLRFVCDRDKTAFGLRTRKPPTAPIVLFQVGPIVTEKYIREQCHDDILLLPKSAPTESITDLEMKNFMTGDAYKLELSSNDDYEDIKYDSEEDSSIKCDKKSQLTSDLSSNSNDCIVYSDRSRDASDDTKPKIEKASRKGGLKRVTKKTNNVVDMHDMCDESSDDNSSRSTLDLIIPPPKDFIGENNPFLNESAKQSTEISAKVNPSMKTPNNVPPLTLFGNTSFTPTNNQIRFVNIVKRRLCAKDIMIGPNQEVKRRKYKRRSCSGPVEVISTTPIHAFPKSSSYLPIRTDLKDLSIANIRSQQNKESSSSSSTSTSLATTPTEQLTSLPTVTTHGRRLRKRENTSYSSKPPRRLSNSNNNTAPVASSNLSVPSTSNGNNGNTQDVIIGINDLQSSLNTVFGITNRILAGEKYVVRGKRITIDGRVEFLIEWGDGVS